MVDVVYAIQVASMCRDDKAEDLTDDILQQSDEALRSTNLPASRDAIRRELEKRMQTAK